MAKDFDVDDLKVANEIIKAQRNSIFNLSANHFGAVSEEDLCAQLCLPRTTYTQLKNEGKLPSPASSGGAVLGGSYTNQRLKRHGAPLRNVK